MAKPKALLLGPIVHAMNEWKALSDIAELIEPQSTNRAGFIQECRDGKLDGVVACFRTFASVSVTGLWDGELVNALPKSLQFCAHNGAGYDQIDVHACAARDPPIQVSNTPTAVDDATADTAMFLIIGALRGFSNSILNLRRGQFNGQMVAHDPQGKTIGILGMGGIGRNMKKKCDAFGMKTIYHNRNPLSKKLEEGAQYVSFDQLLAQSDVLSLSLPLNKNTRHIISTNEFNKMKKGVVIINTARGAVMDEQALVEALETGQVYSCGLDVYEEEPKVHPGLIDNPRVLLLPHMGTWSIETQSKMEKWAIGNVRSAIETGRLVSPVPEQADL